MNVPNGLRDRLQAAGQDHLLAQWNQWSETEQERFAGQATGIDLERIAELFARGTGGDSAGGGGESPRYERAAGPRDVIRLPETPQELQEWEDACELGHTLTGAGKVGAILVAGGQGTRLGFDRPKGMYPIGPVSGASLFQILAEQVRARSEESGCSIPYYVMTSDATHEPTIAFFEENDCFGLEREDLFFFRQGNMPAVDAATGQILLAGPGEVALSPDGHGGLIGALAESGALEDMARRGLDMLHYHQVDNPTAIVCEPAFLGWHAWRQSDMSTKIVAKTSPTERMGVVCEVDGSCGIIEYSDLPAEAAETRDARGEPIFWAGNTAMHVLSRSFLETLCDGGHDLPFHTARKVVPYLDASGRRITPDAPNALKFERFIFDALPLARRALVLEADRGREFNPVKNAQGGDSPETARAAIDRIAKDWLARAGVEVSDDAVVEISPLFAIDAEQLARAIDPDMRIEGQVYLRPEN